MRSELEAQGHDAGAATIAYHLQSRIKDAPSRATVWRILKRQRLIVAQPQKRPRSSLIRFEAQLPNEMWQADITAWQLAVEPEDVVHPGLLEGWLVSKPPVPRRTPDEVAR